MDALPVHLAPMLGPFARAAGAGLFLLVLAGTAQARARRHPGPRRARAAEATRHRPAPPESFFLASDPHVPLAVVSRGRVEDAAFAGRRCGAAARWKAIGSRWTALDAWGRPMGVYTVASKEDYEVTGCAELSFAPRLAGDLSHVFVSVDSTWRAPPSAEWFAPAPKRVGLVALAKASIPDAAVPVKAVGAQCAAIRDKARFFRVPGRGEWAIATSNAGWLVARDEPRGWAIRSQDRGRMRGLSAECFRPVAIFDMNGDGVPEIVLRYSGGDGWNDVVLGLGKDDRWRVIAVSPGGSTA